MKSYNPFKKNKLILFITIIMFSCGHENEMVKNKKDPQPETEFKIYRGFNIGHGVSNNILQKIINETGANLIRLSFGYRPLMEKTAPYNFNEAAFQDLERILDWCTKNDVRVVIDPHTTPGTRNKYTIYPTDEFWKNSSWKDLLIKLWVRIANTNKDRGDVIFGYDLLNEPAIPDPSIHGDQWNDLVAVLVDTIRAIGDQHTIIIEPAGQMIDGAYIGRIESLDDLILPDDDNLMVSLHVYAPFEFTHQGIGESSLGISYPGQIGGRYWDKNLLSHLLEPIRNFQNIPGNENIPILIGEFSASRAGGSDGDVYLKDLISLFEAEGWSWTYHQFRGDPAWDPTMNYTSPFSNDAFLPRESNTPRMIMLKNFFESNSLPQ